MDLLDDGHRPADIAEQLGVSESTVVKVCRRRTGETVTAYRRRTGLVGDATRSQIDHAVAAYQSDPRATVRGAAAQLRVSAATFGDLLRQRGIEQNVRPALIEDHQLRAVARAYLRGDSCRVIAERLHVDNFTVRKALDRAGVPRRPLGRPKTKATA